MDHSKHRGTMDHSSMDHGSMGKCRMSMMLNGYYEDLCVLTPHWHIRTKLDLILSMVALAAFCAGFEAYKAFADGMECKYANVIAQGAVTDREKMTIKTKLSVMYAVSVGYSFFIMLLFMSFNVWIMSAVVIGAGVGHYFFNTKGNSSVSLVCH